jgi:hypothetical protein
MTKTITLAAHQICNDQFARVLGWNCDDYIIAYDRRTRVLFVEEFHGFNDATGEEDTTAITSPAAIKSILDQYKPGWLGLDGFVLLQDYYGEGWTISPTPR